VRGNRADVRNRRIVLQARRRVANARPSSGDAGYVEGLNLAIDFPWAENHYDRLPELAADLVRSKVEVIATSGGDIVAGAAKAATAAIPIVFISGGDPVARGFVPQPRLAGRQHERRIAPRHRVGAEKAGARARSGSQCRSDRRSDQSKELKCRAQCGGAAGRGASERRAAPYRGGQQRERFRGVISASRTHRGCAPPRR
jgi:hypothetical protein